jgi:hypothetical protein
LTFSCFGPPGQNVFQPSHKTVILSEAPHRLSPDRGFIARSRRTSTVLILLMLFEAFSSTKPENRIFRQYAPLDGHGYIFSLHCNHRPRERPWQVPPRYPLWRLKSSESHGENKHPRGPSTPRDQVLRPAINLRGAALRMTVLWAPVEGRGVVLCSHHGDSDEPHQGLYPNLISVRRTQVQFYWQTDTMVSPAPANLDSSD